MKKTLAIAGLALWIFGSGWYYTCRIKQRCYNDSSPGQAEMKDMQGSNATGFPVLFEWESETPLTGTGFPAWRDSLMALTKAGTKLQLSGLYSAAERNVTNEKDLGLARAKGVRALFPGLPDSLIVLTSRLDDRLTAKKGEQLSALSAEVISSAGAAPMAAAEALTKVVLYFPSNSSKHLAGGKAEKDFDKLAATLKNTDRTVEIIGHTDNIGTDEANNKMGLLRATTVKSILIAKGVPASKITTSSKGETQAAGPNDTEEGRAKNRRTEIIVK